MPYWKNTVLEAPAPTVPFSVAVLVPTLDAEPVCTEGAAGVTATSTGSVPAATVAVLFGFSSPLGSMVYCETSSEGGPALVT